MDHLEDDTEIVISLEDYKLSQQKCRDLDSEIKQIRSMNQEYIFKISTLQSTNNNQQKQIQQQITQIESLTKQSNMFAQFLDVILTNNLDEMKSINIKLVQKQQELTNSIANINEENLKNRNAIIEQHKVQVKDLEDKIAFMNKAFKDEISTLSLENSKLKVSDKQVTIYTIQNQLINSSNLIQTISEELQTLKQQSELELQQLQTQISKLMNDIWIAEQENLSLKETINMLEYENQQCNGKLEQTNQLFNQQAEEYLQLRTKLEEQIAELDSYRSIAQNSKDNDLSDQKIVPMRMQSQLLFKQTNTVNELEKDLLFILNDFERLDRAARRTLCGQINQKFYSLYKNALKQDLIIKFEIVDNRTS